MANLTLTINDDTLKKARTRAAAEGTSVNAVVREKLESYAGVSEDRRRALEVFLEIARTSGAGSGGRGWKRNDLYEERLDR